MKISMRLQVAFFRMKNINQKPRYRDLKFGSTIEIHRASKLKIAISNCWEQIFEFWVSWILSTIMCFFCGPKTWKLRFDNQADIWFCFIFLRCQIRNPRHPANFGKFPVTRPQFLKIYPAILTGVWYSLIQLLTVE